MTGDLGTSPLAIANASVTRVRRKVGANSRILSKYWIWLGDLSQRSRGFHAGKTLPREFRERRDAGFVQLGLNGHLFPFQQGAETKDLPKQTEN